MGTRAPTPSATSKSALKIRRWVVPLTLCIPLMIAWAPSAKAYGVLTHHQRIDQAYIASVNLSTAALAVSFTKPPMPDASGR